MNASRLAQNRAAKDRKAKDPNREPAKKLWVELATRIATQDLHHRSGNEECAATSVASLFGTGRKLMAEHPNAHSFSELAVVMLNRVIRPYSARWHGWMTSDQTLGDTSNLFRDEMVRRRFRKELAQLSKVLRNYQITFDLMARGKLTDAERATLIAEAPPAKLEARPFASFPMKILRGVATIPIEHSDACNADDPWAAIQTGEEEAIKTRRDKLGLKDTSHNVAGLALSGGGIRSATYALGVVTGLARRGLIPHIDYLSTVSGGGYLGSFLSASLISKLEDSSTAKKAAIDKLFQGGLHEQPE